MGRFDDKILFITGGGAGIGKATATRAAREGAQVIIYGRNQEKQDAVVAAIKEEGGYAESIIGDVSDEETLCGAVLDTIEKYGRIDILINNAGVVSGHILTHENSIDQWRKVIETDVYSCLYTSKAALPSMLERKSGCIINIASTTAIRPWHVESAYTSAKAAVVNFSKTLAQEYADTGIRVNCVCPGLVMTEMLRFVPKEVVDATEEALPMKRMAQPEEIAAPILFLASDDASYMTGSVVVVDGGMII